MVPPCLAGSLPTQPDPAEVPDRQVDRQPWRQQGTEADGRGQRNLPSVMLWVAVKQLAQAVHLLIQPGGVAAVDAWLGS